MYKQRVRCDNLNRASDRATVKDTSICVSNQAEKCSLTQNFGTNFGTC